MSNMFHKPIKKELAALVESKRPKRRLHSNPHSHAVPASNSNGLPNDSTSTPNSTLKPTSSTPTPRRTPTRPDSDEEEYTPSSSFTDFRIVSAPKQLWKYNVMKFAESKDKEVDLGVWRQPVKLNRKEYRPAERGLGSGGASSSGNVVGIGNGNESEGEDVKKTPMLGPDGKPVIGPDGRIVMVGPDGKVPSSGANAVAGSSKSNGGGGKTTTPNGKTKTKQGPRKKIKQVFLVPEEVRKLRREERYPWIFEEAPLDVKPSDTAVSSLGADANAIPSVSSIPGQIWVGHLENPEKSQTHGLLVPKGSTFQFVPSYRYYKFTKKRSDVPGAEEAEAEYAKLQKSKDPTQLWKRRKGALSEATMKTLKSEPHSHSVKYEDGDDFDDSSRRLRTVDAGGDDLFGGGVGDGDGRDNDEYDEEKMMRKRRNRELGQDGDLDEMEYEEEFADDDEKIEMDGDDEEMREMEERLKREYRNANKARDATIDEDEEEEEEMEEMNRLTGAGKDLKKLVKRTEKNEAYESDDDDGNPYASEEEEEEQPPQPILDGPAVMNQQQPATATPASATSSGAARPASIPAISTPAPAATTVSTPKQLPHVLSTYTPKPPSPSTASRPGSPLSAGGLAPPGMGNAIVAKRATSPKVGKTRTVGGNGNNGSSSSSTLTGGGARSPSPSPLGVGNRARTPTKSPMASRAASPVAPVPPTVTTTSLKRKAPDESQAPASPVSPISVADPVSAGVSSSNKPPRKKTKRPPPGPLDESLIINFLREKKDATTKDCIQRFQPYLREEETKKTFTAMVKKVAVVKKDILVLRDEYM